MRKRVSTLRFPVGSARRSHGGEAAGVHDLLRRAVWRGQAAARGRSPVAHHPMPLRLFNMKSTIDQKFNTCYTMQGGSTSPFSWRFVMTTASRSLSQLMLWPGASGDALADRSGCAGHRGFLGRRLAVYTNGRSNLSIQNGLNRQTSLKNAEGRQKLHRV